MDLPENNDQQQQPDIPDPNAPLASINVIPGPENVIPGPLNDIRGHVNSGPLVFYPIAPAQLQTPVVVHQAPLPTYPPNYYDAQMVPPQNQLPPVIYHPNVSSTPGENINYHTQIFRPQNINQYQPFLANPNEALTTYNSSTYNTQTIPPQSINQVQSFVGRDGAPTVVYIPPIPASINNATVTVVPQGQNQLQSQDHHHNISLSSVYGGNYGPETLPPQSSNQVQTLIGYNALETSQEVSNVLNEPQSTDYQNASSSSCSNRNDATEADQPQNNEELQSVVDDIGPSISQAQAHSETFITTNTTPSTAICGGMYGPQTFPPQVHSGISYSNVPSMICITNTNELEPSRAEGHGVLQLGIVYPNAPSLTYFGSNIATETVQPQYSNQLQSVADHHSTSYSSITDGTDPSPSQDQNQSETFIRDNRASATDYSGNDDISTSPPAKISKLQTIVDENASSSLCSSSNNAAETLQSEGNQSTLSDDHNYLPPTRSSSSIECIDLSFFPEGNQPASATGLSTNNDDTDTSHPEAHIKLQMIVTDNQNESVPTSSSNDNDAETLSRHDNNQLRSLDEYYANPSTVDPIRDGGGPVFVSDSPHQDESEAVTGDNSALTTGLSNNNNDVMDKPHPEQKNLQSSMGNQKANSLPSCSSNTGTEMSRDNAPSTSYSNFTDGTDPSPSQGQNQAETLIGDNNACAAGPSNSNDDMTASHSDDRNQSSLAIDNQINPVASSSRNTVSVASVSTNTDPVVRKRFICHDCDKRFWRKTFLEEHMYVHTGEKLYKCEVCNRLFSTNRSLQLHARIHADESPYKCKFCEMSFSQKNQLKVHDRIHFQEWRFVCPHCDQRYKNRSGLDVHKRKHTDQDPDQN